MSKKYVVVGGSSGIGLSLTKLLTEQGNEVVVISRNSENTEGLPNVEHVGYDVTSNEDLPIEGLDSVDGLAYCPGSINLKPFHRMKREDFLTDFDVNVLGATKTIQSLLPLLKKSNDPSIVLFSTVAVAQGMGFHASVAASKGALEGITKSLAAEFAPRIRVNCIAPSIVKTPLAGRLLSTPEKEDASGKRHPLARVGQPEDISEMAAFLLSEKSSWITGQVIGIDGGMSSVKMM